MYKYWAFGIQISSALQLPELLPADFEVPDVEINMGRIAHQEPAGNTANRSLLIGPQQEVIVISGIGRFYVTHGKQIMVEPADGADEKQVRLYLLGTVMAALLYQRGCIPFHASAIVKNGRLTLFTGQSGAGKSTLSAWLTTQGYELFTDDICVLELNAATQQVTGKASYPMIKLWEDSLDKLSDSQFNKQHRIRQEAPKYGQFFHDRFLKQALPIDQVFILQPTPEAASITYTELDAMQSFAELEKQAYRHNIAKRPLNRALHFKLITALVSAAKVRVLQRPATGTSIDDFARLVQRLIGET